ncbi:MAG: hypothetical protein KF899_13110 [Parvibaculum sp.]|nr:hypothetical protein [Parvibaculum sp.]
MSKFIESTHFQWLAFGIGALIFIVLRYFGVVDGNEFLGLNVDALISFSFVGLCYAVAGVWYALQNFRRQKFKKSLYYERSEFFWKFSEAGDFDGTFTYRLQNNSSEVLSRLPLDGFQWSVAPDRKRLRFRIIPKENLKRYRFVRPTATIRLAGWLYDKIFSTNTYLIEWSPGVAPDVMPGDSILYEVLVQTSETELDAFTSKGTTLGFPTRVKTREVSLVCLAPEGYRFVLVSPQIEIVDFDTGDRRLNEESLIAKPKLSDDSGRLEWLVEDPLPDRRYWINYRFEKKDDYDEAQFNG